MNLISDYISKVSTLLKPIPDREASFNTWSGGTTEDLPIHECPFVVFDTELSGLKPRKDCIVSIGAVKMTGATIHAGKDFYRLVHPDGNLTKKSVEIHGLTPDELKGEDELTDVLPDFLEFVRDSVLIGHFRKSLKDPRYSSSEATGPSTPF
jgi:DNA polymerase III epsilon subunit-like protein